MDSDIAGSIRILDTNLKEANTAFNSRQEILSGVS
jgi:hypothetical protein